MLRMYVHRYAVDVMHLINVAFTFFEIEHACICKCRSNTCILYYIGGVLSTLVSIIRLQKQTHKNNNNKNQELNPQTHTKNLWWISIFGKLVSLSTKETCEIVFYVCWATRHASKMQLNRSKTTITIERPQQKEAGNMIEIVWKQTTENGQQHLTKALLGLDCKTVAKRRRIIGTVVCFFDDESFLSIQKKLLLFHSHWKMTYGFKPNDKCCAIATISLLMHSGILLIYCSNLFFLSSLLNSFAVIEWLLQKMRTKLSFESLKLESDCV